MSQHLDIACAPKGKTPLSCIDMNGNVESVICDDLLISCSVATHQYVSRLAMSMFTIYHQGFFHSVRRNPSLNFPQTPVSGYSWPRRTQVADKVVSPSCFRSSLSSCPFSWCPLCHSFRPSVVFESRNVSRPSMYSLVFLCLCTQLLSSEASCVTYNDICAYFNTVANEARIIQTRGKL